MCTYIHTDISWYIGSAELPVLVMLIAAVNEDLIL